jgi:hypothetical protein
MAGPVSDARMYGEISLTGALTGRRECDIDSMVYVTFVLSVTLHVVESPRAMIGALMTRSAVNTLIDTPYNSASATSALAPRSHGVVR